MDKKKIINKSKSSSDDKTVISVKLPVVLKDELSDIASKNDTNLTSLVVALIDEFVNGEERELRGLEYLKKLEELVKKQREFQSLIDKDVTSIDFEDGLYLDIYDELELVKFMIKKLKDS